MNFIQQQFKSIRSIQFGIFVLWVFMGLTADGQSSSLGSWNILNIKYNHNKKWSAFAEGQIRSLKYYDDFHYYEYKGGFNYKLHPAVQMSLGLGSYQTFREGGNFETPKNNDEFRLWPQLIFYQSIGKLKVEQRYRSEMRWTSNGYRNRFRYRLGFSLPLGKEVNGYQPFLIAFSNELFFTDREPYFERNRLQATLSYRMSKQSTFQVGYLHQFDYRINDETGRDFFVMGFYFELFRKADPATIQPGELKDN